MSLSVYWAFFGTAPWRWGGVLALFLVHFVIQVILQLYVAKLSAGQGTLST